MQLLGTNTPASTPPTTTSTAASTSRVLSAFNPTKTYHIPSHGGLLPTANPFEIVNLTPLLKYRVPAKDPYSDRKQFKREVRAILRAQGEGRGGSKGKGKGKAKEKAQEEEEEVGGLLSSPSSSEYGSPPSSSPSTSPFLPSPGIRPSPFAPTMTLQYPAEPLPTAYTLRKNASIYTLTDGETATAARWSVPWGLWKPILITLSCPSSSETVGLHTHDFDPRSQTFSHRHSTYRWRFANHRELVLEKSAKGIPKYVVAVFYLSVSAQFFPDEITMWAQAVGKRGVGKTEGTLLLDERGVDRVLGVVTLLVALKRERQRWAVLGGTV
ncbi:hypothetical protein FN846DRAFT_401571 [Sphaerosporella brunnea]|uniref:Uncharacterized protein n=1 Tax=Sphaerosporella brunnea TaxID=1250544 RepID=A0A5J5EHL0_9PEZI|nr:hypothetical protein FN846DRAFT_401571 [Sphaerosporella brunnea]